MLYLFFCEIKIYGIILIGMEKTYFEQREIDTIEKLRMVKKDLPVVCNEFFIGIEHTTSPLTRLGYALDLRIFFDYLTKEIDYFVGKNVLTLSYEDFELIIKLIIKNIKILLKQNLESYLLLNPFLNFVMIKIA